MGEIRVAFSVNNLVCWNHGLACGWEGLHTIVELIMPNMLYIWALNSVSFVRFLFVLVSLMGLLCIIAGNYTFTMLGILREFRTKKGPKEAKRGTDGHQQLYSAG